MIQWASADCSTKGGQQAYRNWSLPCQAQATEWVSDPPLPELIDLCKKAGQDTVSVKVQQLLTLKK